MGSAYPLDIARPLLFHRFSVKSQPDLELWGVNMSQTENSLVPFASRDKGNGGDQLDKAGQSILNLLQEAAGVAEKNSRHALAISKPGMSAALCGGR